MVADGRASNEIQNPEVFSWKYGTVRRSDIQNQRYMRQMVRQFLFAAQQAAGEDPRQAQTDLTQMFPLSDDKLIQSMILQKKADETGNRHQRQSRERFPPRAWTDDRVKPQHFAEIIATLNADRRSISQSNLFDALRFELAALNVQEMFSPLVQPSSGGWDSYFPRRYARRSLGLLLPPES